MLKLKFIICTLFFFWTTASPLWAQVPPGVEAQAKARLEKVGGNEDEVRQKLLDRGIDVDNINPNNPQEVLRLQQALQEIEAEIKAETKADLDKAKKEAVTDVKEELETATKKEVTQGVKEVASSTSKEISKAVKDGATVEEAVAEGIIDAQEEDLPPAAIYGQHIFRNKEISVYRNANDIVAPDSYILGAGDKLAISLWGYSELDAVFEIKKEGYIKPEGMSRINLKGISLGKAKNLLRSRFSNYYRFGKDQFEVTVTYPRTITVHIVGEVMNSGSFTMPAINTAFNALAAAGGPTDIGSVRNIKLIRPGGQNRTMDVYEYLLNPTINKDYFLQDNDIIHVGVAKRLVAVQGAIRRPFKYELKNNEQLKDLIKYSGGLQPDAYQSNFKVKRFIDDEEKIIDVDYRTLQKTGRDFTLMGGDKVVIGVIPTPYKNYVEIIGSVDIPGKYELEKGMKVQGLVEKGVLAEYAKTDLAYLLRTNTDGTISYSRLNLDDALKNGNDNLILKPKDKLVVFSQQKYLDKYEVSVTGAVRSPSKYQYDPSEKLTVEDLIILGGGLRKDATDFAYIYRKDPENTKEKEYIRIDIKNAIENPDSPDNVVLRPNDELQILSKLTYVDEFSVRVGGAVRNPGEYQYHPSLTLKDVLTLSGGLKLTASKNRIDVFRVVLSKNETVKSIVATVEVDDNLEMLSQSDFKLEPFDQIIVRSVPEFELQRFVTIEGEVKYPGAYALLDDNEKLVSLIKRAGGLTGEAFSEGATLYREEGGTGFVVLRLEEALKNKKDRHNFILKKGDVITIPKQKDLVAIVGATRARDLYPDNIVRSGKINVAYKPGKRAKWYVDEYAAGVGEKGKSKLITVEYPNGEIKRTKNFILFKIYPKV
ncbi:MAG TPA: hypothetical protein ENJ53_07965, partial [Phaeodactylibacter sp.]|nr:hypothetical protein [Phaeodactylibacter sp.]